MAQVTEYGTVPSVNYLDQFFTHYPTDTRFASCQYIQVNSIVSIEGSGTELIFVLNATVKLSILEPNLFIV
jgi:hypothetical protein